MPEDTGKTIRVPVAAATQGHRIRTIVLSRDQGIKALYDVDEKKIITYLFLKDKDWTMATAKEWVSSHQKKVVKQFREVYIDQNPEFIKIFVDYADGNTDCFEPANNDMFEATKSMEDESQHLKTGTEYYCPEDGWHGNNPAKDNKCPECGASLRTRKKEKDKNATGDETSNKSDFSGGEEINIVKVDAAKHLVYGVFLWPDKADHDGDIIREADVEKVAHGFLIDYRNIDEMHSKEVMKAEIVESFIAWQDDLPFHGKVLKKGAWAGAIHVSDDAVWEKIEKGEYKGFSVRIAGRREPVEEGANGQQ